MDGTRDSGGCYIRFGRLRLLLPTFSPMGSKLMHDRHPLQELTVFSYVANDTFIVGGDGAGDDHIGSGNAERSAAISSPSAPRRNGHSFSRAPHGRQDQSSMLMMNGPNYSGKSVHLKQVALIVYMAHVGCFVPADTASIGLTDKILTRFATKETITRAQSAFMIDLQQVTKALSLATHRSLVIVDEFGKGTDSNGKSGSSHLRDLRAEIQAQMALVWPVVCLNISLASVRTGQRYLERPISMKYSRMGSSSSAHPWFLDTWRSASTRKPKE